MKTMKTITNIMLSILCLGTSVDLLSKTVHISQSTGNDSIANGTLANPFKSWEGARHAIESGDVIKFYDGTYTAINEGLGPQDIFSSETVITAAENSSPRIIKVTLGANGGQYKGIDKSGIYQGNITFKNIHILDGVECHGATNIKFIDCKITRIGPWTGSVDNINKTAIHVTATTDFVIDNCEITETGIGISMLGQNITIRNSHIHDITHDGIQLSGCTNALIEYNQIHGLDDGVYDDEESWSRHCDGIHFFVQGAPSADLIVPNTNITIRGNHIYDTEAQGVQFNNYFRFPELKQRNFKFYNNVLGPTGAITLNNAEAVDSISIFHNTFVTGSRDYSNPNSETKRTITCSNSEIRVSSGSTKVELYNNILKNVDSSHENALLWDYNLVTNPTPGRAYPRHTIFSSKSEIFSDNSAVGLKAGSPAIDAGTALQHTGVLPHDINGTPRDNRPDIGSFEVPYRNPEAESQTSAPPENPMYFLDDFEDGDFLADPFLSTHNQIGISWLHYTIDANPFTIKRDEVTRNLLSSPIEPTSSYVLAALPNFETISISFIAKNYFATTGIGLIFKSSSEAYIFLDIGRDEGNFVTDSSFPPNTTNRTTSYSKIALPHTGFKEYSVAIKNSTDLNETVIEVDADSDGIIDALYTLNDDTIKNVGFYKSSIEKYKKIHIDDFLVLGSGNIAIQTPRPPTNLNID
jgi:hypothetical protein